MNMRLSGALLLIVGAGVSAGVVGCGGSKSSGAGGSSGSTTSSTKAATGSTSATSTGSGSMCDANCRTMNMAGFNVLNQAVVQSCGCAMGSPCATQCMSTMVCTTKMGLPTAGSACDTCIQAEGNKGQSSTCSVQAAFGMQCQNDAGCKAFISCETACATGG